MPKESSIKKCSTCKRLKPTSCFYRNAGTKDGFRYNCKECILEYDRSEAGKRSKSLYRNTDASKLYRAKYAQTEKCKLAMKMHRKSESGRASNIKSKKKYAAANPIKIRAQELINHAVRSGKTTKPTACEECSRVKKIHGHHDDYAFPLRVRWLCQFCHNAWHRENGPGANG